MSISNFSWLYQDEPRETDQGIRDFSSYEFWIHFPDVHVNRIEYPYSDVALRTGTEILKENTWHKLEISTFDGTLEFWIDGDLFVIYQDPEPLPPGGIRIGVGMEGEPENHTKVYFDDFVVCGLQAPFKSILNQQ